MQSNVSVDTVKLNEGIYIGRDFLEYKKFEISHYDKNGVHYEIYHKREGCINYLYTTKHHYIQVTCSVPKLMLGSNAYVFDTNYIDEFFDRLNMIVNKFFENRFNIDFRESYLSEIHVFRNIYFCNTMDKTTYLNALKNIDKVFRLEKTEYKTSVQYANKSSLFTIYDKVEEIIHKDKEGTTTSKDLDALDDAIKHNKHILRFEGKYKKKALDRLVDSGVISDRKAGTVMSKWFVQLLYNKYLGKLRIQYRIATRAEVVSRILATDTIKTQRTKDKLIDFLDCYNNHNLDVHDYYSKSQITTFKNRINSLGYSAVYLQRKVKKRIILKGRMTNPNYYSNIRLQVTLICLAAIKEFAFIKRELVTFTLGVKDKKFYDTS